MIKTKHQLRKTAARTTGPADSKLPFIEHVYELRRRLFYVAVSVLVFSVVGYLIQKSLIGTLLKPAEGQQFIYTSPGGGINFIFQISIYFGLTVSVPLLVYQLLRYIEPLIEYKARRLLTRYAIASIFLAALGVVFGYVVGLPAALHFLAHQFTTRQIEALLTIQEYMSFVTIYLLGSALLFQIPLILSFINRIRPLKPSRLIRFERYWILIAFTAAAIITPTPDIFNQMLFAGPIIAVYQIGILLVYLQNRGARKKLEMPTVVPVYHEVVVQPQTVEPASPGPLSAPARAPVKRAAMDFYFRARTKPAYPQTKPQPPRIQQRNPGHQGKIPRRMVWDVLDPYAT